MQSTKLATKLTTKLSRQRRNPTPNPEAPSCPRAIVFCSFDPDSQWSIEEVRDDYAVLGFRTNAGKHYVRIKYEVEDGFLVPTVLDADKLYSHFQTSPAATPRPRATSGKASPARQVHLRIAVTYSRFPKHLPSGSAAPSASGMVATRPRLLTRPPESTTIFLSDRRLRITTVSKKRIKDGVPVADPLPLGVESLRAVRGSRCG